MRWRAGGISRTKTDQQLWGDQYMSSRESEAFLRRQYAEIRDTLTELGLAAKAK